MPDNFFCDIKNNLWLIVKTTEIKRDVQTYLLETGLNKVLWEHIPVNKHRSISIIQHTKEKLFAINKMIKFDA